MVVVVQSGVPVQEGVRDRGRVELVKAPELAALLFCQADRGNLVGEPQPLPGRYLQDAFLHVVSEHGSVPADQGQEDELRVGFSALDDLADREITSPSTGWNPIRRPVHVDGPDVT